MARAFLSIIIRTGELDKKPLSKAKREALTSLITNLHGVVNDVRTIFMKKNEIIYIPSLSITASDLVNYLK